MKLATLVLAMVSTTAGQVAGTWEGKFGQQYAGFDLDVIGDRISGDAYIEGWPFAGVSGRVEGERFRFTARKIEFEGMVTGDSMSLTMMDGAKQEATLERTKSRASGPLSLDAPPQELAGEWTARFVGRIGDRPKMIGRIDFDFQVDGNTLSGMAHMPGWPGDCPISEGKVENGRFSFVATGRLPSSSGIPVIRFEGEIHGTVLKLSMRVLLVSSRWSGLELDAVRRSSP